jgi:hypothetical protein
MATPPKPIKKTAKTTAKPKVAKVGDTGLTKEDRKTARVVRRKEDLFKNQWS